MASTTESTEHYRALDSMRALAAFVVMIYHAAFMLRFYLLTLPYPFSGILDARAAVVFFFVLSGFVLHLSCSKTGLTLTSYAGFQLRRIFRIYPLYYFSLIAAAVIIFSYPRSAFPAFGGNDGAKLVLAADHTDFHQWIQQILLIPPDFNLFFLNPPSWTLAIEMRMAIIFPVLSVMISRLSFLKGAIFILATLPCLAVISEKLPDLGVASAFPLFALGAFLAQHRNAILNLRLRQWHLGGLVVLSLMLYSFRAAHPEWLMTGWYACGFGSLGFLVVGLRSKALNDFLSRRELHFFGNLSYGIYILHFPVLLWLSTTGLNLNRPMGLLLFALGLALTIVVAFFMHRHIEQPFIKFGRMLSKKLNCPIGSLQTKTVTVQPILND